MSLTGRYVLVEYDVGGAVVLHERWAVEHVAGDDYIIITPDEDVYCEELSILNQDLRSIRVRPAPGVLPAGVVAAQVYPLPAWGAADLARLRAAATAELAAERARRGGVAAVAAPVAPAAAQPVAVAAAPQAENADEEAPGLRVLDAGQDVWVAAESVGTTKYGDVIQGVLAVANRGAKTVHTMPDGQQIFCMCVRADDIETFNARPSACDPRIVRVRMNAVGTPERPLAEIVAETREFRVSWKLTGPRTSRWCLNYLVIEGLGFEQHHERFRQLCRLDTTTWGVVEHFQMSMMLRQLIQVDCLNGFNNLGIELLFRRLQTIEYAHSERARDSESKAAGGRLSVEEQYTFGSMVRQSATLMIAPSLLDHVKTEVERDVQLQKNLRKAREERELSKKQKGKQKGDDSHP